jgi:hypothetical protein
MYLAASLRCSGALLLLGMIGCPQLLGDDWVVVSADGGSLDASGAALPADGGDSAPTADAGAADALDANVTVETTADASADAPADTLAADGACTPFPDGATIHSPASCPPITDTGEDAPPPCTPFPQGAAGYTPDDTTRLYPYPEPRAFALDVTQKSDVKLVYAGQNTPIQCQCKETYTCACLLQFNPTLTYSVPRTTCTVGTDGLLILSY